jgi:hypothetical protein
MNDDPRNISNGHEIPAEGYCDQPYVVVNDDGSWTCVMTTGRGEEGDAGQHVVSTRSVDHGRTWTDCVDIEPGDGPEASWGMPLRIPETGRIYAFYTYNRDNLRSLLMGNGARTERVDSVGVYAYRYSDDHGRSWSAERFEIPMRPFQIDLENAYGGRVLFHWGVGKPFLHMGRVYLAFSKVGVLGKGFFEKNVGALLMSPNLATEMDPHRHEWETLPDGDEGLTTPPGGGPIAGEFNVTPMNDGSLYGTYRTMDGYPCHVYSRDGGRTWSPPEYMTYTPGGKRIKNPRAANFVRRLSNGHYIYWFHNNGGPVLTSLPNAECRTYHFRNPVWMCGGIERDGFIYWSQPEVILYDDNIDSRISYPDFVEADGRVFVTETQKRIARVHELDSSLLKGMWAEAGEPNCPNADDAVLRVSTPGEAPIAPMRCFFESGGVTLHVVVTFDDVLPAQILLDSRNPEGVGILLRTTDAGSLSLDLTGHLATSSDGPRCGLTKAVWESDPGLLQPRHRHCVTFMVDFGPKIVSVMVDGVLCDGGEERQYGWGRFHPNLCEARGAPIVRVASGLNGQLHRLCVYDRCLRTAEVAAIHAASR